MVVVQNLCIVEDENLDFDLHFKAKKVLKKTKLYFSPFKNRNQSSFIKLSKAFVWIILGYNATC